MLSIYCDIIRLEFICEQTVQAKVDLVLFIFIYLLNCYEIKGKNSPVGVILVHNVETELGLFNGALIVLAKNKFLASK